MAHLEEHSINQDPASATLVNRTSDTARIDEKIQPDTSSPSNQPTEATSVDAQALEPDPAQPLLSKNQLKKLKRKQIWEDSREDRKRKRKEKRHEKADRRRELVQNAHAQGIDPATVLPPRRQLMPGVRVPVGLIIDCDFERYMLPEELISMSGQLIRCYSDNRHAPYQAHLILSSFGGKLKERFDVSLGRQHENWVGVRFVSGDYRAAAREAHQVMSGPDDGELIDLLASAMTPASEKGTAAGSAPRDVTDSIVYLTSDSPNTLTRLEPYTSYVIGGIVDRNREKGLCFRKAQEHGVRTAKLPIGEYMALSTRHVLTTNQVADIMLKWLECGDWGTAFMRAIPPRKGGRLKVDEADAVDEADENAMSSNLKTQQPVHGESTSSDCGAHDKQGTADAGQEDVEKAAEGTHP